MYMNNSPQKKIQQKYRMQKIVCPSFGFLFFALIFSLCNCSVAWGNESQLQIKPARCIALHEGQVCYQTLHIIWQADIVDNYCLYQQGDNTPLLCWENVAGGAGSVEFANNTSAKLLLVRKRDGQAIAEFMMEVAWVYDAGSHRESHWRVF